MILIASDITSSNNFSINFIEYFKIIFCCNFNIQKDNLEYNTFLLGNTPQNRKFSIKTIGECNEISLSSDNTPMEFSKSIKFNNNKL